MSLAARFPLKTTTSNGKVNQDEISILTEEPKVCMPDSVDSIKCHDMVSSIPDHNKNIILYEITDHRSTETLRNERGLTETNCQGFGEETVSSQDSFDPSFFQGTEGIRSSSSSNSEAEEPIQESEQKKILVPTSTNVLSLGIPATFQDFYIQMVGNFSDKKPNHEHGSSDGKEHEESNAILNKSNRDKSEFCQPVIVTHKMASSDMPSEKNQLDMSSDPAMPEGSGDESTCSWASNYFESSKNIAQTSIRRRAEQLTNGATNNQVHESPITQEPMRVPQASSSNHLGNQQMTATEPQDTNCQSLHNHQIESRSEMQQMKFVEASGNAENGVTPHCHSITSLMENVIDVEERISSANKHLQCDDFQHIPKDQNHSSSTAHKDTKTSTTRKRKAKEGKNDIDWDSLRRHAHATSCKRERNRDCMDSLDYEALRNANVHEISQAIKERGMNNMLAERMKVCALQLKICL